MKKPLRSRFLNHDYRISWEPKNSINIEADVGGVPTPIRCLGLTDEEEQSIRIEDTLPDSLERAVLIHETLHQLFNSSGLGLGYDEEEGIVSYLGEALAAHIRENPTYWRYVTRRTPKNHGQG